MNTFIRRSSIIAICLLVLCTMIISFALISILTTDNGKTWAQGFKDSHAAPLSITVETPLPRTVSAIYHTDECIGQHIHQSKKYPENHIVWSHDRLQNAIGKRAIDETSFAVQDTEEKPSSQSGIPAIDEHIQRSWEIIDEHIQRSQERLENLLAKE